METTVDVMQSQIDKITMQVVEHKEKQIKQLLTEVGINVEQPILTVREELDRKGISIEYRKHKDTETLRAISAEGEVLSEKRFTMKGVL